MSKPVFREKSEKNINLSSADVAQRVVKVCYITIDSRYLELADLE